MKNFAIYFKAHTGVFKFAQDFKSVRDILRYLTNHYWYHYEAYAVCLETGDFYRIYDNSYRKISKEKNVSLYNDLLNLN